MKKTVIVSATLLIIGLCAYLGYVYVTRPAPAPSDTSVLLGTAETVSGESAVYRISVGSEASFSIYELLNGKDKTVVGVTPDIAGDIRVINGVIEIGELSINARTLRTDSLRRDGAISRLILKSDVPENEFITFSPRSISGAPKKVREGEDMSFSVTGDLTISGVTRSETFEVTARIEEGVLSGMAQATISRKAYSLVVPNLPFIANVADAVELKATIAASQISL